LPIIHIHYIKQSLVQLSWTVTRLILKKSDADPDELKSYRPTSNLTFISKVIERIVVDQITRHLDNANLMPPLQSAYCRNHSTETALMKVVRGVPDVVFSTGSGSVGTISGGSGSGYRIQKTGSGYPVTENRNSESKISNCV